MDSRVTHQATMQTDIQLYHKLVYYCKVYGTKAHIVHSGLYIISVAYHIVNRVRIFYLYIAASVV